ncbi:hypothetical protein EVAR_53958_1 [Eumeta japonica]|uniref:Uncharacterized protein n=1 Tax=Eumeta variegata TaxID=151549 RepID=A0A4C1XZ90_EUMVA|nr:hypothetical protein EVAR_53958_1 [Eumeta japonica]
MFFTCLVYSEKTPNPNRHNFYIVTFKSLNLDYLGHSRNDRICGGRGRHIDSQACQMSRISGHAHFINRRRVLGKDESTRRISRLVPCDVANDFLRNVVHNMTESISISDLRVFKIMEILITVVNCASTNQIISHVCMNSFTNSTHSLVSVARIEIEKHRNIPHKQNDRTGRAAVGHDRIGIPTAAGGRPPRSDRRIRKQIVSDVTRLRIENANSSLGVTLSPPTKRELIHCAYPTTGGRTHGIFIIMAIPGVIRPLRWGRYLPTRAGRLVAARRQICNDANGFILDGEKGRKIRRLDDGKRANLSPDNTIIFFFEITIPL